MKAQPAKQVHYDSGPNMTPLVDVVMVILIFLMLAGSFGGGTQFLLSRGGIHRQGVSSRLDPNQVLETSIDVHVNSMPSNPAGFVIEGAGISATSDPEKMKDELAAKLAAYTRDNTPTDQLQVTLYPGRSVKYDAIIKVYQAALRAGFTKVAFATSH